ncbi:MAG: hypothetical protein ACK4WH_14140, partial [Phycisphaerales bacterium]
SSSSRQVPDIMIRSARPGHLPRARTGASRRDICGPTRLADRRARAATAEPRAAPPDPPPAPAGRTPQPPPPPTAPALDPTRPKTGIVPLNLGGSVVHIPVEGTTAEIGKARLAAADALAPDESTFGQPATTPAAGQIDLALIARRCRLKARACDLVVQRLDMDPAGAAFAEAETRVRAVLKEAKALPWCFLWATFPDKPLPPADVVATAARVYENLALAAEVMIEIDAHPESAHLAREGLAALAEAQSALRAILARTWLTRDDQDQFEAYLWLRDRTQRDRVFLDRFLRLDDPADPDLHADLAAHLAALRDRAAESARTAKDMTAALNKLRYHARKFALEPAAGERDALDLRRAAEALRVVGVSPADERTLEALGNALPHLADRPDMGEFLAASAAAAREAALRREREAADSAPRAYSPAVARVRAALRGSTVVVIGGKDISHQRERLAEAFGLAEVVWAEQNEHATSAPFEAPIARPQTRLVLALVKLAGHQHIDDARRWCRQYGKPLVMIPAGFNPEQVAAAVLEQASGPLGLGGPAVAVVPASASAGAPARG